MDSNDTGSSLLINHFPGRLAILQRVLPSYRVPFFEMLSLVCEEGLHLAAGTPRQNEAIDEHGGLKNIHFTPIDNYHILSGAAYLLWQKNLIDWLEDTDPDALIVEANPRNLSTRSAITWMKTHSKPVIGWGLGSPESDGLVSSLLNILRKNFLQQFNAILAYSQSGVDQYRSLGIPANRVFVAHNAVSPRPTNPLVARDLRSGNKPAILFVGRLQKRKRLEILLHACSKLPAEIQPRLIIVGDGPERKSLEMLAESVFPSTEFLGSLHGPQLEPVYEIADLFVLPGTGGLAIQQAMGWSLPVIAAEGDGTQQDLVTKGNGWLIPSNNLSALADTLLDALSDIPRLRAMGSESYRIVTEEINLEKMVSVFTSTLNLVSAK